MRLWQTMYFLAFLIYGFMLTVLWVYRNLSMHDLQYLTAMFTFGASLLLLGVSAMARDEALGYGAAYGAASGSAVPVLGYIVRTGGVDYVSVVLLISAMLILAGIYLRYGGFEMLDYMWIFVVGYTGFWVIIVKFSWIGRMALFFAVVTLVVIVFMSYVMLQEEMDGCSGGC